MRSSLRDTAALRGKAAEPSASSAPSVARDKAAAIAWQPGLSHNAPTLLLFPTTSLACTHRSPANWFHWQLFALTVPLSAFLTGMWPSCPLARASSSCSVLHRSYAVTLPHSPLALRDSNRLSDGSEVVCGQHNGSKPAGMPVQPREEVVASPAASPGA